MLIVMASVAAALASAGSSEEPQYPTPYQPGAYNGGYWTTALGNDMFQIDVKGNSYTGRGTVLGYAYRRANEVCASGFDVVDSAGDASVTTTTSGRAVAWGDVARAQSTTTSDVKPRVTLIIRCKPVQTGSGSATGAPGAQ